MKTLAEFTKTTLIGGILIVLPIYVSILLLLKAISGLIALVNPITAGIPASVEFRGVLAILVLVAICFVTGLIVRTGPGLRAKNAFRKRYSQSFPAMGCCVASPDVSPGGPMKRLCSGACRDRRGVGPRADHRGTGRWIVHGAGAIGANADGGSPVHPAEGASASG